MDVVAGGALKRPDVEPIWSGRDPRQHRRCLAVRTLWAVTEVHDASPRIRRERKTLSHRKMPIRGGDQVTMEPQPFRRWSILLTFEKLMSYSTANQLWRPYLRDGSAF